MKRHKLLAVVGLALTVVVSTGTLEAQHDPGPRGGAAGAGGFFPGLSPDEQSFFNEAIGDFMEVDSVSGSVIRGSQEAAWGRRLTATAVPSVTRNRRLAAAARDLPANKILSQTRRSL